MKKRYVGKSGVGMEKRMNIKGNKIRIRKLRLLTGLILVVTLAFGCDLKMSDDTNNIKDDEQQLVVNVEGISLNKSSTSINTGSTEQLTATIEPSDATDRDVTWESSDESIATVSSSGLVIGITAGSAVISVTINDGGFTTACTVTVSDVVVNVIGISLNKESTSIDAGSTEQLTATIDPLDATNQNIIWESSDDTIATVSPIGLITGITAGSAVVTVTTDDGGFSATCTVTVSDIVVNVTGISLNKASTGIDAGLTEQLTATIDPLDATNQNIIWKSSDDTIATVSSIGLITGITAGSAVVTVTTDDGGFSATCTVTVTFNCLLAQPIKVLFIGNSYTSSNSLPSLVNQLACSLGYNIEYDSYTPGGYWFLNHKDSATTLAKINSNDWDYVVLQNQSQVPGWKPADVTASSLPNAVTLVDQIKGNNAQTEIIYFATWGRQNGDSLNCGYYPLVCTYDGHTTALKEGYDIYQAGTGGLIASVGVYWRNIVNDLDANRPFDASTLWSGDGSHPSLTGSYLAAAVILRQIISAQVSSATYDEGLNAATAAYILSVADMSPDPV